MKLFYEPLFASYVFVYIHESEINLVKQLNNVVNLVYWKGQPAIIQNEEIEEIREFVSQHHNIRLERSRVNYSRATVVDRPSFVIDGNVVMIKNNSTKVHLASLGLVMNAETERSKIFEEKSSITQGNLSQKKNRKSCEFPVEDGMIK